MHFRISLLRLRLRLRRNIPPCGIIVRPEKSPKLVPKRLARLALHTEKKNIAYKNTYYIYAHININFYIHVERQRERERERERARKR